MEPTEQKARSRKYLALPVFFIPVEDGWAMFTGIERKYVTCGTWAELEDYVPQLTDPAKPQTPRTARTKLDLDNLLKGL